MAVGKLVISELLMRRARGLLTVAAIAVSVSLVVAVTSGFRSIEVAAHRYLTQYLGSTDVQITRKGDFHGAIPQDIVTQLSQDSAVGHITARLETDTKILSAAGEPLHGRAQLIGLRMPHDPEALNIPIQEGQWFGGESGAVAVIDQQVAKRAGTRVGGKITLPSADRRLELQIVAIVHKPDLFAEQIQSVYVPLRTLQQFIGMEGRVNRIMVDLKQGADAAAFAQRWAGRLTKVDPQIRMRLAREIRGEMDKNLQGLELLSYMGGAVALLAATFIIFSALSMGVAERSRVLAMLRAVGALRSQVARLVVTEAILLAGAGIVVGVPLGWLWIKLLAWRFADYFQAGAHLSGGGLLFGTAGSLVAALLASLLPAWMAMRVSPLEGLSPLGHRPTWRGPLVAAVGGLLLIGIDPLLLFVLPLDRSLVFYVHLLLGLPSLMFGYFLLAPLLVILVERLLGPLVAGLLRVNQTLLRQQLSGSAWRGAGTAAALMVGLAVLVVLQTQGSSALAGWRLPDKFPDMFAVASSTFYGEGMTHEQLQKLQNIPGIRKDAQGRAQIMPISISVVGLPPGTISLIGAAFLPDSTMFLGVDPDHAFDMMELDFRLPGGKPAPPQEQKRLALQAAQMLKRGRHVIITDEFREIRKLNIGDTLVLKTPRNGDVPYTVAGVVWSPGIDVMVNVFDVGRMFEQRSAGSVFGSLEDARRDFGVERINLFALNLDYSGVKKEVMRARIQRTLGLWGLSVGDVRQIKQAIVHGFRRLLMLVTTVAIAAIAVASLGVTNTVMASIRSRRWQLGILRSIGVTRGLLLRGILAEAVLLGLVGTVLGLGAGLEMSLNANRFSRLIIGYGPPIDVPWMVVILGVGIIMAVSIVASLWPALSTARTEPLKLLQSGRAAA